MNISKGRYWDASWNPVTGCTPCGPACDHCWARSMAMRFPELHGEDLHPGHDDGHGILQLPHYRTRPFGNLHFHEDRLEQPDHWRRPRVVATCWLGDLFHDKVPALWRDRVFDAILRAPHHKYLLLTKRYVELGSYWHRTLAVTTRAEVQSLSRSLWFGASAWDQHSFNDAVFALTYPCMDEFGTWVSLEPLLGPVEFGHEHLPDQVIVGAETGPGARPIDLDWVRRIRDDCAEYQIPFFLKSLGPGEGRDLDGRTHDDLAWAPARATKG